MRIILITRRIIVKLLYYAKGGCEIGIMLIKHFVCSANISCKVGHGEKLRCPAEKMGTKKLAPCGFRDNPWGAWLLIRIRGLTRQDNVGIASEGQQQRHQD
jgi:hypothetical protein